jgi:hypothetical protein
MSDKTNRNWFARHKVLTGIAAFIVLIVIVSVAGGGSTKKSGNTSNGAKAAASKATTAKIGEPVRDGQFEFVITSNKCGETTVGTSQYAQAKAQGQFCRVNMTIKNIGDKAQSLFADNQKLVDGSGKEYSYASTATIYAAPTGGSTWYDQINPGNTVTGDVIFDVPAGVTPVTAVLHDSSFSGGVKVSL